MHQENTDPEYENERLHKRIAELEQHLAEQEKIIASHKRLENQVMQLHVLTAELQSLSQRLVKARDQAVEASKFKSQFLANMSHEIRTPMNALIGVSDLLMRTNLSRDQSEYALMIRESASNLLGIVNDILDFSKVEAGKLNLELCDLNLVQVIEGAAELLAEKAHQKKLSLMTFIQPQIPQTLRGDPTRLRQIILNLVSNAIKFTESGEVFIHAMLEHTDDIDDHIKIIVKDSGIGIPVNAQKQIFIPFTQADNSVSRKYGGTGLGLSICRRLVELMGGEIGLESVEGKGTTFWFTIPMDVSNHQAKTEPHPDLSAVRVLLIDGPSSATKIVQSYATNWSIKCDTAENGGAARALVQAAYANNAPYHIVVLENALQDMTGEEFAHRLADETFAGDTKIILFNSTGPLTAPKNFHTFSGYLTAPMKQLMLLDCIKNIAAKLGQVPDKVSCKDVEHEQEAGRHILIAEDNHVNQRVAVLQLQQIGFSADVVSNGEEAIAAMLSTNYDLILMDCQMPIMDGFEATREIRKAEIRTGRHIPIVAMTAHAMEGDREKCIAEGMDDYISKPVNPNVLTAVLEKWLQIEIIKASEKVKEEVIPKRCWNVDSAPPLDVEKLKELCPGHDDLERMVDMFMTTAERLMKNLNIAIQDHDMIKIRSVAYELTGTCVSVGADELSEIGESLQKISLEKNWTQCKILFEAFRQALDVITDYARQPAVHAQS